jgi:hypothetical protein
MPSKCFITLLIPSRKTEHSGFNPQPLCPWLRLLIPHFCDEK